MNDEDDEDALEDPGAGPVQAAPRKETALAPANAAPLVRWPKDHNATDVIFETWGGFGARCPDCGFTFVRPTAEEAREAVTYRDQFHGLKACREMAARLSEKEKALLEKVYAGTPTSSPRAKKPAAAKRPAKAAT